MSEPCSLAGASWKANMFLDTIEQVADWFVTKDRQDLAGQIWRDWCWSEVALWATTANISDELRDEFVAELIATGNAEWMYLYQRHCGHRDDVVAALIATGNAQWLYRHQRDCGHRDDVVAALIATGNAMWLYFHQRDCGHRDDVVAALIATGKAEWLYYHHLKFSHRDDVFAALIAIGDMFWLSRVNDVSR